jgi:hypothetical protein
MLGWALLLAFLVAGCGGPATGTVSGKVSYKDTPLKGGRVTFVCAGNKSASGEIDEEGKYTIEKVPVGEAKIVVETEYLKPRVRQYQYTAPADNKGDYKPPDFAANAKKYVQIPDKYTDADNTDKKLTVKSGSQQFDIKLD